MHGGIFFGKKKRARKSMEVGDVLVVISFEEMVLKMRFIFSRMS